MIVADPKKALCLLGSPRRGGNSDALAHEFCKLLTERGFGVKTVVLSDLTYNGCINLFHCKKGEATCGQRDGLTNILSEVEKAQTLILTSPIFFTNVTGQLKLFIDRMFSFLVPDYAIAPQKSKLSGGRTLVGIQTQGEGADRYADVFSAYEAGFRYLGYDHQYVIRAYGVRDVGDVLQHDDAFAQCKEVAAKVTTMQK